MGSVMAALLQFSDDDARSFCAAVKRRSPHRRVQSEAAAAIALMRLQMLAVNPGKDLREVRAARAEAAHIAKRLERESREFEGGKVGGAGLAKLLRSELAAIRTGMPAAGIEGVDADGRSFKLSDYRGQAVVLCFFSDACPYCKSMYPLMRRLSRALATTLRALSETAPSYDESGSAAPSARSPYLARRSLAIRTGPRRATSDPAAGAIGVRRVFGVTLRVTRGLAAMPTPANYERRTLITDRLSLAAAGE